MSSRFAIAALLAISLAFSATGLLATPPASACTLISYPEDTEGYILAPDCTWWPTDASGTQILDGSVGLTHEEFLQRADPQQAEPEAEHKDVPWIPILILALAIPTAALVVPAFFMAKRHDDGKGPPG